MVELWASTDFDVITDLEIGIAHLNVSPSSHVIQTGEVTALTEVAIQSALGSEKVPNALFGVNGAATFTFDGTRTFRLLTMIRLGSKTIKMESLRLQDLAVILVR